jgi:hypothetical protein
MGIMPAAAPGLMASFATANACLDILRGAHVLAQVQAVELATLLKGSRRHDLPWLEALAACLGEAVAGVRASPPSLPLDAETPGDVRHAPPVGA